MDDYPTPLRTKQQRARAEENAELLVGMLYRLRRWYYQDESHLDFRNILTDVEDVLAEIQGFVPLED